MDRGMVSGIKLRDTMYADDVALVTTHEGELQTLCNALSEFCGQSGMTVNVAKTEVVVFQPVSRGISTINSMYRGWETDQKAKSGALASVDMYSTVA